MMLRMDEQNGSVIIPSFRYNDANAAMVWLERAFGFVRHAYYPGEDGSVQHAELRLGASMVMLGSASNKGPHQQFVATPGEAGGKVTTPVYLVVPDCDPVWESAKAAGAEVVMALQEMSYGGRSFSVRDPEGYLWSVGEYNPWTALEAAAKP
jgi:uncharacterized glyoxalase superfamily protein PhnB